MALKIENEKIVGKINDIHSMNGIGLHDNLQEKLNGELAINRLELLYLVNSWGRNEDFYTNENIIIPKCEATQCYDLSKLDTSQITDMNYLFTFSEFNGDISKWDVSNVTDMGAMFCYAENFNQDLNNWDVSNVTNMSKMFYCAENFNQDLDNWDVLNVINMNFMFYGSKKFNSDIGKWNTSNVTDMSYMFSYATRFNQPLNFDTSKVTNMMSMFCNAYNFNQNISSWNFDNIINCDYMFDNAKAFLDKYNNSDPLPNHTDNIKDWVNLNRDKMNDLDLKDKHGEEVDNFFFNITNIHSRNKIGLHENNHLKKNQDKDR